MTAKVFVGSIPTETTEEAIKWEFTKFGPIVNFFMKRDNSGPQRSWAFISFQTQEQATKAIEMTAGGRLILPGAASPCEVSWARSTQAALEAEAAHMNMTAISHVVAPAQITAPAIQAGPTKVFVGSIPAGITKEHLTEEFSKLGQVAEVFLKNDSTDPGRMWGFITYSSPEGAALAVATLNEQMVFPGGIRPLAVSYARSSGSDPSSAGYAPPPVAMNGLPSIGPTKLFVGSIPTGTPKEVIKGEFEKFGPTTDVFLKTDTSEQGRMWGFVTYMEAGSAAAAVSALHERLVLPGGSRACTVRFAKNSQAQHSMAAASLAGNQPPTTKLFLGTIPAGTTEQVLRTEFERFGQVTEIFLRADSSDTGRMWGFLTYADSQAAAMAVSTLHEKLMLPGSIRPIAVSFAKNSGAAAQSAAAASRPGGMPGAMPAVMGYVQTAMPAVMDHGWKTYYNADGIPYYHHAATNRTQWEMPPEMQTAPAGGAVTSVAHYPALLDTNYAGNTNSLSMAVGGMTGYMPMTAPAASASHHYSPY